MSGTSLCTIYSSLYLFIIQFHELTPTYLKISQIANLMIISL